MTRLFVTALLASSLSSPGFFCSPILGQDESSSTDKEKPKESKLDSGTFAGLSMRSIGPALMSGRIADIAVDPNRPNTWYVAAGSGNLWKTTSGGVTWSPIFDNYPSYSMGCVTIDPNNSNTIWVGTGENNGGRHIGFGDGVYVSRDGGKSFKNTGLKKSEHISKILIDPRDSNVVFAASQGPLWSPGGERGLYKSTDGGQTWKLVLSKGEYTGVTDVVMDSNNPDVLYAATHQRHRNVWALINAGPESGIHKSTDGGETWKELKSGLPGADKGKISLQISPQKSNVVYATIELAKRTGGFYRSQNYGESWEKMSDYVSGGTGPHYYQEIFCDPHRFDVIYQVNVRLVRSEDGGKTWDNIEGRSKHVDNHAIAFSPIDPDFLVVGCDGGVYISHDYAQTYRFVSNLPLTQFYKLDVDYDWPFYHVIGGTQDNFTQYGPTRTRNVQGIRNADWKITIGGDGHDNAIDPTDPNVIYCESQQGFIRRYDRKTGESVDIRPRPGKGEEDFRFNWDSPILISPHSNTRIYFGSKHLHRSDDRGDSWKKISPDLSRNRNRYTLPTMGRVWSIDAAYDLLAMSRYANITSISESPVVEGLLYVGTDDGLIQISEDGGENWRKVDKIYGVPEFSFVNDIKADLHDADTVYACLDNHKTGDYAPYLVKSTDRGKTWESMNGDLPDRHLVWRIEQDHERKDLFFLATEFGIFFTLNGGEKWIKITSGVPTISFRDLAIQRRENDLVGASFGRGFYVLDDYSPLRQASDELFADSEFHLFPIRTALWYIQADTLGGQRGFQGDSLYAASNPPYGAVFTYYLRDSLKSKESLRKEKEGKIKAAGGDVPVPDWDALRAEELEDAPVIYFEIKDDEGHVVSRVNGSTSKGIHRTAWNFRYTGLMSGMSFGPLAPPGHYSVQAFKRHDDQITPLSEDVKFEVKSIVEPTLPMQDRQEVLAFLKQAMTLANAVRASQQTLEQALEQLTEMKQAIARSPAGTAELAQETRQLELRVKEVLRSLSGDQTKSSRYEPTVPSINGRLRGTLFGAMNNTYGPTQTQREQVEIAREQYGEIANTARQLVEEDLKSLDQRLAEVGIPWTPGRMIPPIK